MAIQKKHGKGRLDKWYRLAKEKGYRARAAFKLIQLNKKYGFLEKSKVVLDLCAAPGSWCQVAAECMPAQSIIVGVDLAPIKPIPRVITFQSDITTEKCRTTIRQHLKHWKADTVLHDGAPNVGTAWVQDAFSQAELVLQSLKLATEFLAEGGTFVTKVFRSKDYNPLLWVFKQLFASVEATKPPSSRNVSAEIFVVCRNYKAPKRIDPKFLDPKHVFAELADPTPNNEAKVFNPEKKKRKREGYEEGDYTQFKEVPVTEFINTTDPIAILGSCNKLSFQQSPSGDLALATLERLEETTDEIKACCEDLKVLGKKEFRNLLRWRLKVREQFGLAVKKGGQAKEDETEEVAEVAPMDDELAIQEELMRLREKETSKQKKERRKENERKRKEIVRLQMHMTTPMDIGKEQLGPNGEDATFSLKRAERGGIRDTLAAGHEATIESDSEDSASESDFDESDDEEDRLERELDNLYEQYQDRKEDRDTKLRAKKARKDFEADSWDGFSDDDKEDGEDSDDEGLGVGSAGDKAPKSASLSNSASLFFDQDIFQGLEDIDDVEDEDDEVADEDSAIEVKPKGKESEKKKKAKEAKKPVQAMEDSDEEDIEELEDPRKKNGQLDIDIITAEAMALAQQMATGEKKSSDVVDDGFNRFAFRDSDGLPEWFLDDENKHSIQNRPITKAAAAAIKEKMRAINARPIKKVMEAKGRKKFKAAQRLEKLRKKSALLADDEALSERDKSQAIARLMSRATKKKPKQQVKLVVAKGNNRGISGRPRGVKGKYKIVDSRMKKDIRAQKRLAKKKKN
ncbi:adoMet-dependent rRNA methyltransferase spb1 [Aspergillus tubingensis]|uniref:rRNA methyltransferase Spb1 n=2 Tax=Aspergillus subgen. Circumdati TaxID=2720871 RepID=A0A100IRV7_ASPNG|nr:rRNA methyltransferase Spb1 [Aspergillus tubingensis]GAQ46200.1 rRNA methyltransferase Spb1 [Aspergillus niger]GFN10582.1 rRNA methyltransferase Spb1 [Aspergillus tubingensis]GLA63320.1 adoMet-dependent rRNA methyltransferase spb1 [Aspergillus tubingensis]GLA77611.1 adoMet-dependent rRNA methyltransferase spb1 [Aspergillus tubingensis]GLA80594.1 adoMet-dependent rRNA methyltransferase spb1 [Aspergillus tubingensis]